MTVLSSSRTTMNRCRRKFLWPMWIHSRFLQHLRTQQRSQQLILCQWPATFTCQPTIDRTSINSRLFNLRATTLWFILQHHRILTLAHQKWLPSKYIWDHWALRHPILLQQSSSRINVDHPNYSEGESTTASIQVVIKCTPRARISRRTWELIQVKNHINVPGKVVSGDSLVPMSSPGIIESTQEPNRLNVSSVIGLLPDPIIWHCTWNAINHNSNHRVNCANKEWTSSCNDEQWRWNHLLWTERKNLIMIIIARWSKHVERFEGYSFKCWKTRTFSHEIFLCFS